VNYYEALRLRAMRSVLKPDSDYQIRNVLRWYSKTYHTPLHFVETLPLEAIFTAFYEEQYEKMSEEDREAELQALLETDEQRIAREKRKDEEEASEYEFFNLTAKASAEKKSPAKDVISKIPDRFDQLSQSLKDFNDKLEALDPKPPPEIDMKFVSESEFEDLLKGKPE